MQFSPDLRAAVAAGDITMSVRLWSRPKVHAGPVGDDTVVHRIGFRTITDPPQPKG